jgi:tripartite-type tricarboxylate transporter receptor subunit TctC
MLRRDFLISAAGFSALSALPAWAADPAIIRIIVGATPSGGTDTVARLLANDLSKRLGRQFIVENKPGAGGNIAANTTAKSTDGATLLLCYTSHAINASLYPSLPFDPVKDFTPLSYVVSSPSILVVKPSFRANTVKELIALGKREPGKLNIALPGIGSAAHLAAEVLRSEGGIDLATVPYKGTGPAITDVMGGHIDMVFAGASLVMSHIRSGTLKALGVTSLARMPLLPNIPAISETLPNYEFSPWYGLLGPANMKPELAKQIADATRQAVTSPEMRKHFIEQGMIPVGSTPEEFSKFLVAQIASWGKIVKATGAQPG